MPIPTSIRNLKNAFLIGDLRNKIIFTLFIIAVYRLGDNIICPGIDFNAVQSLASAANKGGVIAYLNLFSGGALTKMAVFGLGIMPYITSSIIIQLLMVVIPKFEQWREEGPSGQRKLTQVTRYMTIALAIMQSTGLAYAFHNGGHRLAERITARIDDRQIMRRYGLGAAPRRFCTPGWHPLSAVRDKISIPYRPPY